MPDFIIFFIIILILFAWKKFFEFIPIKYLIFYFFILLLIFFKPIFFKEWFVIPHYSIYSKNCYPFSGIQELKYFKDNPLLSDVVSQFYPWYFISKREILLGRFPLYNPYSACGMPLLENAQSSIFSFQAIISLFINHLDALSVQGLLNLLLLLIFTHSYLRTLNLSHFSSSFGALSFSFCTYVIAWLYFPHIKVLAYLPLNLYCIEKISNKIEKKYFLLLIFSLFQSIISGHPESAFFIISFSTIYAFFILNKKLLKYYLISFLISIILSSFFLIPFLDYLKETHRYQNIKKVKLLNLKYEKTNFNQIANLINPLFFGDSYRKSYFGPNNFNELSVYPGIFALFFSFFSYKFNKKRIFYFYLFTFILVLLIIIKFPKIEWLIYKIPILKFSAFERLRVFISFSISVLSALGIEYVEKERKNPIIFAFIFFIIFQILLSFSPVLKDYSSPIKFYFSLSTILFLLYLFFIGYKLNLKFLILIFVFLDLYYPIKDHNKIINSKFEMKSTPAIEFLKNNLKENRFLAESHHFFPNLSGIFGLEDVRYNDPTVPFNYYMFLLSSNLIKPSYWIRWINFDSSALDFLSIKYILTSPYFEIDMPLIYSSNDGKIYENKDALNKFFIPEKLEMVKYKSEIWQKLKERDLRKVVLVEGLKENYENNKGFIEKIEKISPLHYKIYLKGKEEFWVASSIPYLKPWKVYINGKIKKKFKINGHFISFKAPKGKSIAELKYTHTSFYLGLILTIFGFIVFISLIPNLIKFKKF